MTSKAWDILSYFAYETVAQIVDLAFLVRRDNEAGQISDPIERNTVPRISPLNAELNKVCLLKRFFSIQNNEMDKSTIGEI